MASHLFKRKMYKAAIIEYGVCLVMVNSLRSIAGQLVVDNNTLAQLFARHARCGFKLLNDIFGYPQRNPQREPMLAWNLQKIHPLNVPVSTGLFELKVVHSHWKEGALSLFVYANVCDLQMIKLMMRVLGLHRYWRSQKSRA